MDLMNFLSALRNGEGVQIDESKMSRLDDLEDKGVAIDIFDDSYVDILEHYVNYGELPKGEKAWDFLDIIEEHGFTLEEIVAFHQFSEGSNMIKSFENGISKEEIQKGIVKDLIDSLDARGMSEEEIKKVFNYCEEAIGFSPLAKQYEYIKTLVKSPYDTSVCTYLRNLERLENIEKTVENLKSCLNHPIGHELTVYRAVDEKWMKEKLGIEDLSEAVGRELPKDSFMSTSLGYGTSFAKYDEYNVVFEIKVPKEAKGFYGTSVSTYGSDEDELLLKDARVVLGKVNPNFIDEKGKQKILIEAEVIPNELENKKEKDEKIEIDL